MNRLPPEVSAAAIILGAAVLAAILVNIVTAATIHNGGPSADSTLPTAVPHLTPLPRVVIGPLDGLPTSRELAVRRPIAAIFDNFYPDARPQAGISRASVVFEAPVEGGVTRLMGIYLEHDASTIGPIRSSRTYFVSWAAGFRALFVHAGGAPNAIQLLNRTAELADVDALRPRPQFYRSSDRADPHNLYGSTEGVRTIAVSNGWDTTVALAALPHKPAMPRARRGHIQYISIDFSLAAAAAQPGYQVSYRYDAARNVYLRSTGGNPSTDANSNKQLGTNNVVVLSTTIEPIPNDSAGRLNIQTTGSGPAVVFRDGRVIHGVWTKPSDADPIDITSSNGQPIKLDPGTTWFEVAPATGLRYGTTP